MKSVYVNMMLPMTLATAFATAHPSISTPTNPIETQIEESLFPQYDNRIKLGATHFDGNSATLSYERLKLDSMYYGVEVTGWKSGVDLSAFGGYNFLLSSKDRITPIAGLAYYKATHFDHLSPIIGVLYEHAFTDKVRLGANFKANWCTVVSGHPRVYLGVPFAIQIGEKKNWELEVQPYTVYTKGWEFSHNSIGIQSSIGYRF